MTETAAPQWVGRELYRCDAGNMELIADRVSEADARRALDAGMASGSWDGGISAWDAAQILAARDQGEGVCVIAPTGARSLLTWLYA